VEINAENLDRPQNSTRYLTWQAWGKEEEKTLIPGPVGFVEKLILAQHSFKPAPAAIGNVP